ncbi:Inner membrane ABC transporter permease protein ycjP [uncultured Ruminococcus sp.]|uniref:Carbohydrate ABC transporter permease n=1 Tax=Massiliimalia timonensis TaxID=1987501 RepID=A0A8J6P1N4_9FIRM|nr:carbohydrate ABC transporter permease [Massiliimalia timonensis]MBC8611286.1 carbohydrate ABC transporter permease [Massiliimalia timonensis]MBS7176228.1 carbohydrate ABC transporter permease [Clostridiales bacterium]SCH06483.1 Inner membrane ABC transporter permease protein ycjP [uncultured Clostridium sp.]SCI02601.1 Inner membrane ABC transporter permease protein ycjP [uncultured Ruminococcus sp.]
MKIAPKDRAVNIVIGAILFLFALICIYPLYFVAINSFSSPDEVTKGVYFLPRGITLENFDYVFETPLIFTGVIVSVSRTVIGTLLNVLFCGFLGYMVTVKDLPFRKWIYRMVVATMYFTSGLIPWYMLMVKINFKNSFLLYVLPGAISAFYVVLIKTYVESLPASLEESASLDGAGTLTIFFKIILPVCKPVLACVAVFGAVWQWNSWSDNMFLVTDAKLQTLQYLLYRMMQSASMSDAITGQTSIQPMAIRLTMTFITILPILLVYPFMQRFFVKGIMLGSVKG